MLSEFPDLKEVDIMHAVVTKFPIPRTIRDYKYPVRFYFANKNSFKTMLCSRSFFIHSSSTQSYPKLKPGTISYGLHNECGQ
jgi:hypothetical protein